MSAGESFFRCALGYVPVYGTGGFILNPTETQMLVHTMLDKAGVCIERRCKERKGDRGTERERKG